jgi:hypothetical protein
MRMLESNEHGCVESRARAHVYEETCETPPLAIKI